MVVGRRWVGIFLLVGGLAGCAVVPPAPPPAPALPPPAPAMPPAVVAPPVAPPAEPAPLLQAVAWQALSGWGDDDLVAAWPAFRQSCAGLKSQPDWQLPCNAALALANPGREEIREFFERHFVPHRVANADGGEEGMITGYYEPLLKGSRKRSAHYRYPLYAVPDDLLVIDLASVYPELKNLRLRGRIEGRKVVPYYTRGEIDNGRPPLAGRELYWAEDPVELFFLQIQGSGRIQLPDGSLARVGYADQNGHPYQSIGRLLVERSELPLEKASMQGIKDWVAKNPQKGAALLAENASYVFFRELPGNDDGPLGALGVPLTAGRSLAVDPRFIPLGAPVFLATTWPNSQQPLNRLMMAQDTGGAIKGAVRGDFFWGFGADAGRHAGAMKQRGRLWLLLPRDYPPLTAAPLTARR